LEFNSEHGGRSLWGRKLEEYTADFFLISKRTLSAEEFRIFRYHFLLGADSQLCCRKLKMDRGLFFHAIYRIEQKLGRVFRELEPYGLYPLDEYFSPIVRTTTPVVAINAGVRPKPHSLSSRIPLRRVA